MRPDHNFNNMAADPVRSELRSAAFPCLQGNLQGKSQFQAFNESTNANFIHRISQLRKYSLLSRAVKLFLRAVRLLPPTILIPRH